MSTTARLEDLKRDLARLERIGQVEVVVDERLVRLDLRNRIEVAAGALALLGHPVGEILVAGRAASGDQRGGCDGDGFSNDEDTRATFYGVGSINARTLSPGS